MRLRGPAVQRDHPRQQAKARQARQPDAGPRCLGGSQGIHRPEVQGAVEAPRLPAGDGQQDGPQTTQHKPQLAGLGAAGEKRATQGHHFRHHHQPAEVIDHDGGHGGGHQQVGQQAVGFRLRVAVPGNGKQADKKRRQADGDKPYRPDAGHLHAEVQPGYLCVQRPGLRGEQRDRSCPHRHGAGDGAADPGNGTADWPVGAKNEGQHRADDIPRQRLVN